jgi:hypothetical protein
MEWDDNVKLLNQKKKKPTLIIVLVFARPILNQKWCRFNSNQHLY